MITLLKSTLAATIVMTKKETNPIKLMLKICMISIMGYVLASTLTYSNMISVIYLMVFMGGIIMMFMMLSSTLPNTESTKTSIKVMYVIVTSLILSMIMSQTSLEQMMQTNMFQSTLQNNLMMLILINSYFMVLDSSMANETTPMRNFFCKENSLL